MNLLGHSLKKGNERYLHEKGRKISPKGGVSPLAIFAFCLVLLTLPFTSMGFLVIILKPYAPLSPPDSLNAAFPRFLRPLP
jgi:hypothetical protein